MTLGRLDHDLTHSRNVVEVDEVLVVVEVDVVKEVVVVVVTIPYIYTWTTCPDRHSNFFFVGPAPDWKKFSLHST